MYVPESNNVVSYVRASDFAFSFVQSSSPVNGASSMYHFSITLSVDTPKGAILLINLPDDIFFDSSRPFQCNGTMGFAN